MVPPAPNPLAGSSGARVSPTLQAAPTLITGPPAQNTQPPTTHTTASTSASASADTRTQATAAAAPTACLTAPPTEPAAGAPPAVPNAAVKAPALGSAALHVVSHPRPVSSAGGATGSGAVARLVGGQDGIGTQARSASMSGVGTVPAGGAGVRAASLVLTRGTAPAVGSSFAHPGGGSGGSKAVGRGGSKAGAQRDAIPRPNVLSGAGPVKMSGSSGGVSGSLGGSAVLPPSSSTGGSVVNGERGSGGGGGKAGVPRREHRPAARSSGDGSSGGEEPSVQEDTAETGSKGAQGGGQTGASFSAGGHPDGLRPAACLTWEGVVVA
ncbi:MAG: hypothetical protein WDW38_000151 [Sanguina aurantia]